MSAHVSTMRRQERHQDEQQKNYLKDSKNSSSRHVCIRAEDRQHRCHQPTRELKARGKCWHSRDLITDEKHSQFINCHQTRLRSPYTTFHRFQSTAHLPKYARVTSCSHRDVVMLFCHSFTQSERFLQTDQLTTRLQVVVMTNFIRMLSGNAAIFRTPHRCSTNCCICQSPGLCDEPIEES